MPTPVFVCRLPKDLQNAIRNYALCHGITVGDVVSEAFQGRGTDLVHLEVSSGQKARSAPIFSCRIPATFQSEVRACARSQRITVTAVVTAAIESWFVRLGGGLDCQPIAQLHQKNEEMSFDFFVIEEEEAA